MKLVYTEQAIISLQECLNFFPPEMAAEKVNEVRDRILAKADKLLDNPNMGQLEEYLEHMGQSHRRIINFAYIALGVQNLNRTFHTANNTLSIWLLARRVGGIGESRPDLSFHFSDC